MCIRDSYKEGLGIGYRHTDRLNRRRVNFAFGHGLSYTDFKIGDPTQSPDGDGYIVTVPVSNTGSREGAEVIQAYVSDSKSSVSRPLKELKAFGKINLKPGESGNVTLTLGKEAFAFFNPASKLWTVEPGTFEILIGNASDAIKKKIKIIQVSQVQLADFRL